MNTLNNPLRLNVGFLIKQPVGVSREFLFNYQNLRLEDDLYVKQFSGSAVISRTPQGLVVQVALAVTIKSECVRCLNEFVLTVKPEFTELYAFTAKTTSESGLILPKDGHIDLAPITREYILLELPINPVCRPDCRGLCPVCGEDLNQNRCYHEDTDGDPRLAKLRNLLLK